MEPAPSRIGESAIVIPVAVPAVVRRLRRAHDPSAALGVPAHITLLYPFVPPAELAPGLRRELQGLVASHAAFDFALISVERFPEVIWLAPDPAGPFRALTGALTARFPAYPPYGGIFDDVIPHLTVADGVRALTEEGGIGRIERAVARVLPLAARAREVWVLSRPPGGRWSRRWRLRLGPVGASG